MDTVAEDKHFMHRAVRLALRGRCLTRPNPMVGALVVKNGLVIGRGFHQFAGGPHAEVNALQEAGVSAVGATLYVTLEPCNHHGRTPPCTEAVLEAGISRIVIGTLDPNPNVAGQGAKFLRDKGLEVECEVLEKEAREINADWEYQIKHGVPALTLSVTQSVDGELLEFGYGDPIAEAHRFRCGKRMEAGLLEASLLLEAPELVNAYMPAVLFVLDRNGELGGAPGVSDVLKRVSAQVTVIVAAPAAASDLSAVQKAGASAIELRVENDEEELRAVFRTLGGMGLRSVYAIGRSEFLRSLLSLECCRRLLVYFRPQFAEKHGERLGEQQSGQDAIELIRRKTAKLGQEALGVYQVKHRGEPR